MVLVGGVVFVLGVVAAVENGLVQGLGWLPSCKFRGFLYRVLARKSCWELEAVWGSLGH